MVKKLLILTFILTSFTIPVLAHSGRLDRHGGHKVKKDYIYKGRYIYVKEGQKHYETGEIEFKKGDYHYHVQPRANGYRDGIYIPVKDKSEVEE